MRTNPFVQAFLVLIAFVSFASKAFPQVRQNDGVVLGFSAENEKTEFHRQKAERGDAEAQFSLGFLYLYGDFYSNLDADEAKGLLWIRKSAAQGYAQAQDLMGCLLYQGRILAQDKAEAVRWFRKAAEQGDVYAQSNLGYCYYKGEGVAKDSVEAVRWLRLAAAKGEAKAQRHLGFILEAGDGVPKDCPEAAKWFFNLALQRETVERYFPREECPARAGFSPSNQAPPASSWLKAAEGGDAHAQYELGWCHENGEGAASDPDEAIRWYRRSAQGGYAPAQFLLGYFYEWRSHDIAYDHDEVVKWYGKAADQGFAKAQYNLGCYYRRGKTEMHRIISDQLVVSSMIGVPKNLVEAVKWFRKAAENGHAQAQYVLGKSYHAGEGVPEDQVEAFKWWRKAAEQGHATSLFNVGVMCFLGDGTTKDFAEAARWFKIRAMRPHVVFICGHGMPSPRPMVDGIQEALVLPKDVIGVR
jgi:TPR repeat protein